ncbi:putative NADPH:quinone oxidoreductase protein [marine gamma proteobacterium HTCC2080]|nr:putative NADPH:quinone oxidoreductase protein [marine gamma proteobacterium HTCC2080]
MQAVWFEQFGQAATVLQQGDRPTPQPASGEVLVRMHTTGVNPSDVKKRAGAFPDLLDTGPVIPHSDGAGVIEAVGDGVSPTRVGERVFVYQAQHGRSGGTAAQWVCIDSRRAPVLPDNASFEVGACIGIPIMTAHRCVTADGPVAGQWVLVTGGAGRVGYYAIQWARHFGARVVATAGNSDDRALCFNLGAEVVVDHHQPGWGAQLREQLQGQQIQRVVDVEFGANLPEVMECIATGGVIATYASTRVPEPTLPFRTLMFMDITLRLVIVYDMPEAAKQQAIEDTQGALNAEALAHRFSAVLPFEQMTQAHELIEAGGTNGCIVVSVP